MFKKVLWTTIFFTILVTLFFFGFSDSYKYSIEAKVKYTMGDYKEAIKLAQKAYELDPYNKMSFSILTQSKISIKFLDYIEDSKGYLKKIDAISNKKEVTKQDKIKIKMICEVMIGRYKRLVPTVLTPSKLIKNSKKYYLEFKNIYDNLDK